MFAHNTTVVETYMTYCSGLTTCIYLPKCSFYKEIILFSYTPSSLHSCIHVQHHYQLL
jgi:hypothetical protein